MIAAARRAVRWPALLQRKRKSGTTALINAKADAGILLMVSTRDFAAKQGLKLQVSQFKDDQLALKAMIAGEVDSFEGGPQGVFAADAKRCRRQDPRLPLGGGAARHLCQGRHQQGGGSQGQVRSRCRRRIRCPTCWPIEALAKYGISDDDVKLAAVGGDRERYQALTGGVVEAAVVSNEYRADRAEEHPPAGGRPRRGAEFPARVHGLQRQEIGRARRRRREVLGRRNEGAALRALASRRDGRADARDRSTPSPTIRARPSCMTMRSSTRRSIRRCRSRRTKMRMDPGAIGEGRQADEAARPLSDVTAPEYREKALKLVGSDELARTMRRTGVPNG